MLYSKWSISPTGTLLHNGRPMAQQPFHIIYLDDHRLFFKGMMQGIRPFFPKANIINITNGDEALRLIQRHIVNKVAIDLVITDINHPGINGIEFLKELRNFEVLQHSARIPAIVISMVELERLPALSQPGSMIDGYFPKAAEPEDVVQCMEDILYG